MESDCTFEFDFDIPWKVKINFIPILKAYLIKAFIFALNKSINYLLY